MTTAPPTTLAPTTLSPTTLSPTTIPDGDTVVIIVPNLFKIVGPIELGKISIQGELASLSCVTCTISLDPIEITGDLVLGIVIPNGTIELEPIEITGIVYTESLRCNFAKWSKIGRADFTIERDGEAGERPLDWKGCVYNCLKLNNSVVYYGENGVSILTPQGIHMGLKTIYRIGIVCKTAVVGTEDEHYFIDKKSRLFRLTSQEGLKLLDYSEYLSLMTNPVMSMDTETGLIYICDETYGYVYSSRYQSFGVGPSNITGIGVQDGTLYVVSPDVILTPKFHIATDIYDFGTRKPKTITTLELGTDLTNILQVMVETRLSNKESFRKSVWKLVNPSGIAYIPCYGIEFKFNVRSNIYEYLELDYLKVTGVVHEYNYLNSV